MRIWPFAPKNPAANLSPAQLREAALAMGLIVPQPEITVEEAQALESKVTWGSLLPGPGKGRRAMLARLIKGNPFGAPWQKLMDEGKMDEVLRELNKPYAQLVAESLGETKPLTADDLRYVQATTQTIVFKENN